MANDPTQTQQPGPDDLDVIQHPTLGKLSFPKTMGVSDRNDIITQMESDYQKQSAQPGAMQMGTHPGGPVVQAPRQPKQPGALSEFGHGLADPITSLPESGVSLLRDWPEKPAEAQQDYLQRGAAARQAGGLSGLVGSWGHSINAALAPTMIPQTIESLSNMSPARASGNILTMAGMAKAPEAISELPERTAGIRQTLANKLVEPTVFEGSGEAAADARMGIEPEKGITQEGLVGSKESLVKKTGTRVTELKNASNQILKNHPKSTVQIDAAPHIDGAIDAAIDEANKVGAPTDRLEAIRNAMKTQYGPTQGTPLEMNNFASDLQQRARGLGAYKNTQPVEAAASSAMADAARRIRDNVNSTIPEVEPLNSRMANLLDARAGLIRNINAGKGQSVLGNFGRGVVSSTLNKTLGSAPVRTAAARIINAGNVLDVPEPHPPFQQTLLPPSRQLTQGQIVTPPPADTSGPVNLGQPPIQPLAENRQLPAVGGTSGPRTSAGPGVGVNPANPRPAQPASSVPSQIPLPEGTTNPPLPPSRQLTVAAGPSGTQLPSETPSPKSSMTPAGPLNMGGSPPQATVSPYLTGKHDFAIIPAESPQNRAIAIRELRSQGYHPQVIQGNFGGQPGTSVFVPDMPTHEALDFSDHMTKTYGAPPPDSIVTKQGLVNTAKKTVTPIDFSKTVFGPDALTKPSHSIASGGGQEMPFALNPSQGNDIPLKGPYEGEIHTDTTPRGSSKVLGSQESNSGEGVGKRFQLNPRDAVPRVYMHDAGSVPPWARNADSNIPPPKYVHGFRGELSIATIEDNPVWQKAFAEGSAEAKTKGLQGKDVTGFARTHAEKALSDAGYDGYRSNAPNNHGITVKFGDADVFKPGEEPERPKLEPHPNAVASAAQSSPPVAQTPVKASVKSSAKAPKTTAASTAPAGPDYVYRARPVGQEGIPSDSHAQATASSTEANGYAKDLENMSGRPHEVVKVDLKNVAPNHYTRMKGPNGNDWVKFHKPQPESIVQK